MSLDSMKETAGLIVGLSDLISPGTSSIDGEPPSDQGEVILLGNSFFTFSLNPPSLKQNDG